ncbi:WD40-repeat-containing domain protein [Rhodocollybia butyracea]|uniref:WD40-repeat-containing domain protein n=1 Tax=Rhodocollybia butyracea TaxID=206335 RepID=A0A9P5PNC2_9AGAR|nr:WD40-repeat-containing domain protein [Rhodocollybia butyracea]
MVVDMLQDDDVDIGIAEMPPHVPCPPSRLASTFIDIPSSGDESKYSEDDDSSDSEDEQLLKDVDRRFAHKWNPLPSSKEPELDFTPTFSSQPPSSRSRRNLNSTFGFVSDYEPKLHPRFERLLQKLNKHQLRPKQHFYHSRAGDPSRIVRTAVPFTSKISAGAINKIVQYDGSVIVASATTGGQPDYQGETADPYNKAGSLVVWDKEEPYILSDHSRRAPFTKHYTVNDVAICPTADGKHVMISSSHDFKVKIWKRATNGRYAVDVQPREFGRPYRIKSQQHQPPMDIAVKPGNDATFAVASRQVIIHSESDHHDEWNPRTLTLVPNSRARTGAMKWGSGPTEDILFASSESYNDEMRTGCHKGFDVEGDKVAFKFDLDEDGEALAVDALGERVAICTENRPDDSDESTYMARIFDVRRKDGRETSQVELGQSNVNWASFSPDGIYLAIGRGDGHTVLYDSRYLDDILYEFAHDDPSRVHPGNNYYGVVHGEWRTLHDNRLGLLTGGPDGCVRLWQPHHAPCSKGQGKIVAQADGDVAYFTVGNRQFDGEHDLVVGDGDGRIYFFDGLGNI